jgi:hypothetical protein
MLMSRFNQWAAWAALVLIGGCAAPPSDQTSCDRQCLQSALDGFLDAVVAHDPGKAPLAHAFRQTVNAVNVPVDKGVWQTVTGLGDVQRKYFDPVNGQAGYYGTLKEGDKLPIVTIRLRVENHQITEAEWYVAREDDPGLSGPRREGGPPANNYNAEYLAENPPPQRVVPPAERVDRAALIRVAESYYDAITSHDRSVAHAWEGCGRAENGGPAPAGAFLKPPTRANPPAAAPPGLAGQPGTGSRDCLAGLENFNLSIVAARRIPLVDEEAQVVMGTGVFIRKPGSPTPRNVASWWFVIDEGKMRVAYTAMFYPPPELPVPGWPAEGGEGNFPLPAAIVPAPAR